MIITGVAHKPPRLHEKSESPSPELVFLAMRGLREYKAQSLVTSLAPGWEQALAKAALELEIPYRVAIPYPGRNARLDRQALVLYYDLLARAKDVYQVSDLYCESAVYDGHVWQVEQADLTLALWDYEFCGETFQVIDYALKRNKEVVNLWCDWEQLYTLRKTTSIPTLNRRRPGAQVYKAKETDL